jgi:HlyD family secretion protein
MQPQQAYHRLLTCSLLICSLLIFISGCSRPSQHQAQGYIEGRYTYMATNVSGVLKQLLVQRGSKVKKGDVLFALEQQPESDLYNAALENRQQSISARDAIAANLTYAKITYERYKILVPKGAIQQSQLDNAKSIYESTVAQLAQANANVTSVTAALEQAQWTLEQKTISAPVDALVFDIYYRLGEYTQANQAIVSLLAPSNIKAIFYVKQADLSGLRLSEKINVHCDGCEKDYVGKISFISPSAEYTPPVIYSNETNEKLIYRVEAEFAENVAYNLHPGQPVYVSYSITQ